MKKRKWIIPVVLIAGISICCLGGYYALGKWDEPEWKMIATPPEPGIKILAIQYNRVWIESASGKMYFNEDASSCTEDCWGEVIEVKLMEESEIPHLVRGDADVFFEDITLSRRISMKGVIDVKAQQAIDYIAGVTYAFALTEDGLIFYMVHEFWF